MTEKRMIDADALLAWVDEKHDKAVCSCQRNFIFITKEKINELATIEESLSAEALPTDEPVFDENGWVSIHDVPKNTLIEVMINNKHIIKAKFDKNLNICTNYDVNKIKVVNKWRPLPPVPSK